MIASTEIEQAAVGGCGRSVRAINVRAAIGIGFQGCMRSGTYPRLNYRSFAKLKTNVICVRHRRRSKSKSSYLGRPFCLMPAEYSIFPAFSVWVKGVK